MMEIDELEEGMELDADEPSVEVGYTSLDNFLNNPHRVQPATQLQLANSLFPETTTSRGRKKQTTPTVEGKLPYQIGIELTMMPQCLSKNGKEYGDNSIADSYGNIVMKILDRDGIKYNNADGDQKAVEVSSDILKTWKEVETFYTKVSKVMIDVGLKPQCDQLISGGGHIHVGKVPKEIVVNTMRDIQNKPWLGWIFNDPDDKTCNSYASTFKTIGDELRKASQEINANPGLFSRSISNEAKVALMFFGNPKFVGSNCLPDDKSRMTRYAKDYDTLEFRFFRAPDDWNEQKAHIEFVFAYLKYIKETYKDTRVVVTVDSEAKVKAFTEVQCKNEFFALLETLKLDKANYMKCLEDNLHTRFVRGVRS